MKPARFALAIAFAALATLGLIGSGAWLWRESVGPVPAPLAQSSPLPVATAPSAPVASEQSIVQPPAVLGDAAPSAAALDELNVESELHKLFGRNSVLAMLRWEDFTRRVVATVDNLGRSHAPPALWPVNPAGGRFIVETRGAADFIAAANEQRYTPYMVLIEMADMRQVFALYVKLYPLLQQAYAELGFPKRNFNHRLVEVIDLLLATPQVQGPLQVQLPVINAPVQPTRPWLLYQFVDLRLQSLTSGQKLLLRMGPVNGQRLRANLAEIRGLVTSAEAPR